MAKAPGDAREPDDLDRLIKEITIDSYGDDGQLEAFRQAFENAVSFPCDGFVIGEPVSILEIGYAGNVRRGLTATCRREDESVQSSRFWTWRFQDSGTEPDTSLPTESGRACRRSPSTSHRLPAACGSTKSPKPTWN